MGFSLRGMMAQQLAQDHPDMIRRMIAGHGTTGRRRPTSWTIRSPWRSASWRRPECEAGWPKRRRSTGAKADTTVVVCFLRFSFALGEPVFGPSKSMALVRLPSGARKTLLRAGCPPQRFISVLPTQRNSIVSADQSAVVRSTTRASIQRKDPHCAALRHVRKLPRPLNVEARLHAGRIDPPSGLHGDILLAVELE